MVKLDFIDMSLLQSILHGSPEAKEVGDLEIQQHSRLVARGKYLHGFESESRRSRNRPNILPTLPLTPVHRVKPEAGDAYKKAALVLKLPSVHPFSMSLISLCATERNTTLLSRMILS